MYWPLSFCKTITKILMMKYINCYVLFTIDIWHCLQKTWSPFFLKNTSLCLTNTICLSLIIAINKPLNCVILILLSHCLNNVLNRVCHANITTETLNYQYHLPFLFRKIHRIDHLPMPWFYTKSRKKTSFHKLLPPPPPSLPHHFLISRPNERTSLIFNYF